MPTTRSSSSHPVGAPLPHWQSAPKPAREVLLGQYCRLEPLDADRHGRQLYAAFTQSGDSVDWTYMYIGPFADEASYLAYVRTVQDGDDPQHFAIIDLASGQAIGTVASMRIDNANGVMEVGSVTYSDLLKRTITGTEVQYLLMRRAFDQLGYRRYEWKCDSLNAPSRAAALRLGFTFEGIFRQMSVYKGRNRDTAWFSIIDQEWPAIRSAMEQWLAPENFDAQGQQQRRLPDLIAQARQGSSAG
jgi:RimJ/RimL family protein N-acetyltransferase